MAIGSYSVAVTLDETDGAGGVAPLAEGGGLLTLVGHDHAGITTATRVHYQGRVYHVDSVLHRNARAFQTQITCKEVFA